jgi:peroxiredoxin
MARTESTMLPLGTRAPHFALPDVVSGRAVASSEFDGRPLLVAFISNHCPYVKHILPGFVAMAHDFIAQGASVVAISSNDVEQYPDDGPEAMREVSAQHGFNFPYLYDESQEVARAYRAACTPDFFLFDAQGNLAYRGQMDGARKSNEVPVDGADLRAALADVLAGREASVQQRPSLGCNIKWKPGSEPEYFSIH